MKRREQTRAEEFPTEAVGLDSWANIHLIHESVEELGKTSTTPTYDDKIQLATGACSCRRVIGRLGIPTCYVKWNYEGENIDLFPEGLLWDRGCAIE